MNAVQQGGKWGKGRRKERENKHGRGQRWSTSREDVPFDHVGDKDVHEETAIHSLLRHTITQM
jgi:hypothetical protein